MKMWSGRFTKPTDKSVDDFNASLPFDIRLYEYDIEGSIALAKMLAACKIISDKDALDIEKGLLEIKADIAAGKIPFEGEDVHMFVEGELTKRIGDAGKRLHTARSRNDQVATDFRMYVRSAEDECIAALKRLIGVMLKIAKNNLGSIMSGYTHLQKAQPVTLAHHMTAYCEMFSRDIERLADARKRANVLPLGSGALAATTYPIDRELTAKLLGFDSVTMNSLDGVSDRDFAAEFLFCLSIISMHMSRLSEELILWNTDEFGYVELDDAYATGSSIMPQKKNPDIPELIRGKTGRVYGDLMQLLTVLKGLPLAYNKDMQEDKESVFDAADTVLSCLSVMAGMLKNTTFNLDRMRNGADGGYTNATDVADYLVKNGVPFRDAHEITGKLVIDCITKKIPITALSAEDFKKFSPVFKSDVLDAVKTENVVAGRRIIGGPNDDTVLKHIDAIAKKFKITL